MNVFSEKAKVGSVRPIFKKNERKKLKITGLQAL